MVKAYSRYKDTGAFGLIHTEAVGNTVCWSKTGKAFFSAVGTHVVEINAKTGAQTGRVLCTKEVDDEGLHSSSLSLRQPPRVASIECGSEMLGIGCTDGSMRIVKLPLSEQEEEIAQFRGHRGPVNAIAFSESAQLVATGGRDTEIVVWDLIGETGICRLTGHKGEITCLSFLNSDFLISGSKDGVVKVWSIKLQICVQTVTESQSDVWSICLSGSDRLFVGSADKVIYAYGIRTNLMVTAEGLTVLDFMGQLDRPEPADGRVSSLAVSGNCLFAQTDRRVVELWRKVTDTDEVSKRMKRRVRRGVNGKDDAEEESGKTMDGGVRINDEYVIAAAPENPSIALRYVANARVKSMSAGITVEGTTTVLLGLVNNQVELFKLDQSQYPGFAVKESRGVKREGHREPVHGLAVSSDNARLISVSSEAMLVWNAISLNFQKLIYSPSGEVVLAAFVRGDSDKVALFTRDSHCCVVDINTGGVIAESAMRLWSSGDDEDVSASGKKKRKSTSGMNEVKCLLPFIPCDLPLVDTSSVGGMRFLVGEKDRKITTLQLSTVKKTELSEQPLEFSTVGDSFEIPDEPVCLSISPKTNKYIAAGLLNSNIELIYADTGKHYMSLYAHKLAVTSVAFSPDEQVVVSGSVDKNIKVWSVKFGNVLKTIRAHDNAVTQLNFVPHSHLLFSGSRDGVLSLWDIDRFERVMSKVNHPSHEVLAIATSADAGMVFTGGSDRAIRRITRSEDQLFVEDEMEKAMELDIEGEAQRADLAPGADSTVPAKSSIESVRLVERVVQMIEIDEEELDQTKIWAKKIELLKFVATELPPSDLQQVVISLPTGHARRLLTVIAEVMETVTAKSTVGSKNAFPLGFPVEQCVSAGLFLIQAQAKYLIGEPHSRAVLLRLKDLFHAATKVEIERVGIASAAVRFH